MDDQNKTDNGRGSGKNKDLDGSLEYPDKSHSYNIINHISKLAESGQINIGSRENNKSIEDIVNHDTEGGSAKKDLVAKAGYADAERKTGAEANTRTGKKQIDELTASTGMWIDGKIPSLDEFVSEFAAKYKTQKSFRSIVHAHLGVKGIEKLQLSIGEMFMKKWYNQKVDTLVREYAEKAREDIAESIRIEQEIKNAEALERRLAGDYKEIRQIADGFESADQEIKNAPVLIEQRKREIEQEIERQKLEEVKKAQLEAKEIIDRTNARRLVKEELEKRIAASSFFSEKKDGAQQPNQADSPEKRTISKAYNDARIARFLEEKFLSITLREVSGNSGSGFFARLKETYDGVVSSWDELEDMSEIPDADWVASAAYSASKGFRIPTAPYLITAKYQGKGKRSVDTAIALDTSGSMEICPDGQNESRFQMGQRTCLGTFEMMRRLNPKNKCYLAHYNDRLYEVTTAQLMKIVGPDGWTRTDLALKWLLEKLKNSGPSVACLITDGLPNDKNLGWQAAHKLAIEAAHEFKKHPYVALRIFFIDPEDSKAKSSMSAIEQASGASIVYCTREKLAGSVLRDYKSAFIKLRTAREYM